MAPARPRRLHGLRASRPSAGCSPSASACRSPTPTTRSSARPAARSRDIFERDGEPAFRELRGGGDRAAAGRRRGRAGARRRRAARRDARRLVRERAHGGVARRRRPTPPGQRVAARAAPAGRWRATRRAFRALHAERRPRYAAACDVQVDATPAPEVVAASIAGAPRCRPGALARRSALRRRPPRRGDRRRRVARAGRRPTCATHRRARAARRRSRSPAARRAVAGLAAAELERRDVVVAVGGGTVTDAAGFAAATFRRGLAWIAVPTTLVGQVDAAIGGKTAIDVAAKNDVGAFHLPEVVVADPDRARDAAAARVGGRVRRGGEDRAAGRRAAVGARRSLAARRRAIDGAHRARAPLRRLQGARRGARTRPSRALRAVLNLGPHHRARHRGRGRLRRAAARRGRRHRPARRAVALGRVRGLDAAVLAETEAMLSRHGLPTRAAGPGRRRGAGGHARRQETSRPGVPGWCCSTRSARRCGASTPATTR